MNILNLRMAYPPKKTNGAITYYFRTYALTGMQKCDEFSLVLLLSGIRL
jgi:hypothetical protein